MGKKVIKLTESDLTRLIERVISEQTELANHNKAIQCFLNKKGIKDDQGKQLVVDGSIGNYPESKSAQAIYKYQSIIKADTEGIWGQNTLSKMPETDKKIYKKCVAEYAGFLDNLINKGAEWLGLD